MSTATMHSSSIHLLHLLECFECSVCLQLGHRDTALQHLKLKSSRKSRGIKQSKKLMNSFKIMITNVTDVLSDRLPTS